MWFTKNPRKKVYEVNEAELYLILAKESPIIRQARKLQHQRSCLEENFWKGNGHFSYEMQISNALDGSKDHIA